MNKKNKIDKTDGINHWLNTHPGAYIDDYDINNELLDTVDSADDILTENIPGHKKRANHASPSAADPPVPNRAHTEM